jgi:hypothetical protein
MESRNREEAERLIREQREAHGTPEDIERRRDTVGRAHKKPVKSLIEEDPVPIADEQTGAVYEQRPYPDEGSRPDADDEGVRGTVEYKHGALAYDHVPEAIVPEGEDTDTPITSAFTPNDDMAGQGWVPPMSENEGWSHPEEAPEELLHEEEEPDKD